MDVLHLNSMINHCVYTKHNSKWRRPASFSIVEVTFYDNVYIIISIFIYLVHDKFNRILSKMSRITCKSMSMQ